MTEYTTSSIDGIAIRHPADLDEIREQGTREDELEAAFNLVADPNDWKAPIDAWVEHYKYDLVAEAIEYFTATEPRLGGLQNGWKRIIATGYRNGPAGP